MLLLTTLALADTGAGLGLDPIAAAISGASPPVALALALAYGAYQLGGVAARLTAVLERGVRVELAPAERELLERAVEAVEDRPGSRRAPRAHRDAGEVVR